MEGEPRVEVSGKTRTVLQEDKDEAGLFIVKYIPEEVEVYTAQLSLVVNILINVNLICGRPRKIKGDVDNF